jgi:hypothetical protein
VVHDLDDRMCDASGGRATAHLPADGLAGWDAELLDYLYLTLET